ncbi:MAG: hypothetical protein K8L97_20660 [Anaerolineae bacterium]|nr:hypothetical protein [Anaerolineae bacterium]
MKNNLGGQVQYILPKSADIQGYAKIVCEALAGRMNNSSCFDPISIVRGVAEFAEFAARVVANHINEQPNG